MWLNRWRSRSISDPPRHRLDSRRVRGENRGYRQPRSTPSPGLQQYKCVPISRRKRTTHNRPSQAENLTFVAFKGQRSRIMTFCAKRPLEHSRNNTTSYRLYGISHSLDYPYFDEISVKNKLEGGATVKVFEIEQNGFKTLGGD